MFNGNTRTSSEVHAIPTSFDFAHLHSTFFSARGAENVLPAHPPPSHAPTDCHSLLGTPNPGYSTFASNPIDSDNFVRLFQAHPSRLSHDNSSSTDGEGTGAAKLSSATHISSIFLVWTRRDNIECFMDHHAGHFFAATNAHDSNTFRIKKSSPSPPAPFSASSLEWTGGVREFQFSFSVDLYVPASGELIEDVDLFRNHLVLYIRSNGYPQVLVVSLGVEQERQKLTLPDEICVIVPGLNPSFDADSFSFTFIGCGFHEIVFEYSFSTRQCEPVRTVPQAGVLRDDHILTRVHALSSLDSHVSIPVTLYYRKGAFSNQIRPVLVHAYGAYGTPNDSFLFSPTLRPLLDRGIIVAVAHVRGGGCLGRGWYHAGRGMNKVKSNADLQDVVNFLYAEQIAHPSMTAAMGTSAGGAIVANLMNLQCKILQVPFVDPVGAMLDAASPLTTVEYEEWGRVHESELALERLMSMNPYSTIPFVHDNSTPSGSYLTRTHISNWFNSSTTNGTSQPHFPSCFITASMKDQRVAFHQPLKYVARSRMRMKPIYGATSSTSSTMILHTDFKSGHFGESARDAEWLAFLLHAMERGERTGVSSSEWSLSQQEKLHHICEASESEKQCFESRHLKQHGDKKTSDGELVEIH